jgi:hypothetical protein
MDKEYKIEVGMTPHTHDDKYKPYYWVLLACSKDGAWCNEGFGWADSPPNAWLEAYEFYKSKF